MSCDHGILQEIIFGWPFSELERQAYSVQAHRVLEAVGLKQIPVATPLQQLSGGYKRRVALAVQLIRRPAVRFSYTPCLGHCVAVSSVIHPVSRCIARCIAVRSVIHAVLCVLLL